LAERRASLRARGLAALAASVLVALTAAAVAGADGDPASDVLVVENVFYPYPRASANLERAIDADVSAAAHAHFPIKVAVISSASDLGAITNLFGQPQRYAAFLDQEIGVLGNPHPPLLVVMPNGYGVAGLAPRATRAAASLAKPVSSRSDDLMRAAIRALRTLAAVAGHPIKAVPGAQSISARKGSDWELVAIVAASAIAVAGSLVVLRSRRWRAR
jgi:hypothetical protein